jgi:predicted anti-sigma-YlaC factor YlaD
MLGCKDVATRASDYLDNNIDSKLRWQIRLHLMMCSHCRRFIRHLRITQTLVKTTVQQEPDHTNPEVIYQQVLMRVKSDNKK